MHDMNPKTVVCLMGPTASGKTSLALSLVDDYPFELVSVDSALVYKEMDIGTAKPTPEELARVPHHLIDILSPDKSYSASAFCNDAHRIIEDIIRNQKIPLLVGGTMMYFNALQQGLSQLPSACDKTRAAILEEAKRLGWPSLHQRLKDVDERAASRIHPNDSQRIQRALEVYELTGKSLSDHMTSREPKGDYRFINIGLFPETRERLHQNITKRFDAMLKAGFLKEVEGLMEAGINPELPSMRSVGYKEAYDYLSGEGTFEDMRDKAICASRQLAKRQITWLRKWPELLRFDPDSPTLHDDVLAYLRETLV